MLKAGICVKEVTPSQSMLMCGYPEPKDRFSTGAHDPLLTTAYYFTNGKEEAALVSTDICYISKTRATEIRELIESQCGIAAGKIMLCFTHTHSGPLTDSNPFVCSNDPKEMYPEYVDFLRDTIAAAVREAKENTFEAKLGFGKAICGKESGMGGNRHDPDGPQDPEVSVMTVADQEGSLKGCLVNYSMHPTVLHSTSMLLTADFPAYIREYVENRYPGCTCAYSMGAAGDQSTRYFRKGQNFEEAKRIGYLLGSAAEKAIETAEYTEDESIYVASTGVVPPLKHIPSLAQAAADAKRAHEEYDALVASGAPYAVCRSAECTVIGTDSMFTTARTAETVGLDKMRKKQLPIEVQLLKIGKGVIFGFSTEAFVEVGLAIKKASPFPYTMLSFLTNGASLGYICTDQAYQEFCYEAMGSQFTTGAGKALEDGAMTLLKQVK